MTLLLARIAASHRNAAPVEYLPTQYSFSAPSYTSYFSIQPDSLADFIEPFDADSGQFTKLSSTSQLSTFAFSGGELTLSKSGASNNLVLEGSDLAVPQHAVKLRVTQKGTSSTSYDIVGVGIAKDTNNFIMAQWDRLASQVRFQGKFAGSSAFYAAVSGKNYVAPFTIAMSMVNNHCCIWIDSGSGFQLIAKNDFTSQIDFKTASNLVGWKSAFMQVSDQSSTWKFSDFQGGRFGAVGVRDMTLVTAPDGTPVINGSLVYFTATTVDPVGKSCASVFSYDTTAGTFQQIGVIYVSRSSKLQNDLAPHLIWDGADSRLLMATWGNGFGGSIRVIHSVVAGTDLRTGTHIVSGMTELALPGLPTSSYGSYDPMLVYDSANSRWLIAYTITSDTNFTGSPFYAAAAYSADLTTWTAIGADTSHTGFEGTKIIPSGGQYYIAAGGPAGSGNNSRVYNASMVYQGAINATFAGGTDTQPHPMVFGVSGTEYLLTFDNTKYAGGSFSWGRISLSTATRYH